MKYSILLILPAASLQYWNNFKFDSPSVSKPIAVVAGTGPQIVAQCCVGDLLSSSTTSDYSLCSNQCSLRRKKLLI